MDHDGPALLGPDLAALGVCGPWQLTAELAGGRSCSGVYRLDIGGRDVVLKVTRDPARLAGAAREVAVHRELGGPLAGFLPVLEAARTTPDAVRILLAAHRPAPPAVDWSRTAWIELSVSLGRLHHIPVRPAPWLRARPPVSAAAVAAAIAGWGRHGVGDLARHAADQLTVTRTAGPGAGADLVHGDCHVGNVVLTDAGRPLLVDWTEVGIGDGPADLVFLWQRAEFDGARPPREAMAAAYATARRWSPDRLEVALDGCERRSLLLDWPPFLHHGDGRGRAFMIGRLRRLVEDGDSAGR